MSWEPLVGIALFLLVNASVIALLLHRRRKSAEISSAVEAERQRSWYATVTGRQAQALHVDRPGWPGQTRLQHLTVFYRIEDGTEGNIQAYEDNALKWTYTGALAYYKQAPPYDELMQWQEGDRLFKPAGDYFPHREGK